MNDLTGLHAYLLLSRHILSALLACMLQLYTVTERYAIILKTQY